MRKGIACVSAVLTLVLCVSAGWAGPVAGGAPVAIAPVPPVESPRAGLVISMATMEGQVKAELAHLRLVLEAESFADGESRARILPGDVAITDWSIKRGMFGPEGFVERKADGIDLVVNGRGKYRVTLEFVRAVARERLGHKLTLPVVPALVAKTELTVPGVDLEFKTEPAASIETQAKRETTVVTLYGGAAQVVLSWQPKAPEKVLQPVVFADQTLRVRVAQGVLRMDAAIDYSIVQGAVRSFDVQFPADCSLLNITGKDIRTWDVVDAPKAGFKLLKVTALGDIEKEYKLQLRLEKVLPDGQPVTEVPAIEPLEVVRERGQIAVAAAKGLSVEAVGVENISHVDVREMLTASLDFPADELRLGFRYLKRPFTLKLRAGEVSAKTSAEILSLVRAGMDSLRITSNLKYTIRDAGVFQFRVKLDERLKLIDINGQNINNWQLDDTGHVLTVALRAKAEGEYRLTVETELEKPSAENCPVPPIRAVDVDRETGCVAVLPAPGMKVETAALSGISQVDVKELPEDLLRQSPALAYRYIRPDYKVAVRISEIEPEVQAEVQTVATLDEQELVLAADIVYSIRRAGVFQMRVAIPKDLRRRTVEGPDIDDTSWDEEKGILTVNLRSKVIDRYVLRIVADKTLKDIDKGVEMPVISTADAKKERGFLAVVTKASLRIKAAEGRVTGLDDVGSGDLPPEMIRRAPKVAMAFKYFTRPWSLALAVERIQPRVTVEVFNLLSIGEKLMTVSATLKYTILHAGVDTLVVRMPPDATAVDIDGEGIKHKEEDKAKRTWTVTLQSKRTDAYALYVTFQQKVSKDQTVIPYSGVEAVGVERETGYLAVTSRPDVEVRVGDQDADNVTPLDSREIPAAYMQGVTLPVLLAFRYVSHPYTLRMAAMPHDAAEVTLAVVESARLSTTITEEGNMITDLVCMLRNSRQAYLDLQLPESARIWHAFVGGESVTPLRDGRITKMPVARMAGSAGAFELRLRYSDKLNELGRAGGLRLDSPLRDIDVMRLGWTLQLPEKYDVIRSRGTIRRLERGDIMENILAALDPDAEVAARAQTVKTVAAQGGFNLQWSANNEAQQRINVGSNAPNARQSPSIYTGQKPSHGRGYVFQSLIVGGKDPAWLSVDYVKRSVDLPAKGVLVLLSLLAGVGLWRFAPGPRTVRIALLLGVAALVLGARTLADGAYRDYLTLILWCFVVVAGLCAVMSVLDGIRGWLRRHQAEKAQAEKETPVEGPKPPEAPKPVEPPKPVE